MTNSQIAIEIRKEATKLDKRATQITKDIAHLNKLHAALIDGCEKEQSALRVRQYQLEDAADILEDEKGILDEDLE